ncbi:MAG: DNA repair protein RecO [Clostridia bacterium]|nr:DNA repair protein RecO [Clostridia bacterium]
MRGTVDGLILRETAVGESDKLLTVLTAEYGRISISAKGVRNIKNKNISLCRLFTYGNFEYYEKNGMRWLAGGSVNDSFFGINSDIEGFALASYAVDIAREITGEGVPAEDILRMTLNTLYAIEKKIRPLEVIKGVYELFAAFSSGFAPDISACRECGARTSETMFLDVMNGSMLCQECMSKRRAFQLSEERTDEYLTASILFPMKPSVAAAVRYVAEASPKRIFSFELKEREDVSDFSRLGEVYLQNHLERGFDTLEFFKTVSAAPDIKG